MSNLDIFIDYGSKMLQHSKELAAVGLMGSGLSKRQVKVGVRKILKRNKLTEREVDVTVHMDQAVIFTRKQRLAA
jgi:hypothetical protein